MTTPRGFRDRADDSIFTLVGEIPELVRNLVVAEIDAAKGWVKRTAKDAGIGAGWLVGALVVLFWSIPALGAFIIAGLSSWWPVWLSALVLFLAMLLLTGVLALLGILRFRRMAKSENPAEALAKDVEAIRDGL
ncbi:phage holin family protein [Microbacterium chocolatum]|uniref:phage holin family protein n=1 Tax=Microbacterium aurantiacum TaxID=162393 RepID=UPI0033901F1E